MIFKLAQSEPSTKATVYFFKKRTEVKYENKMFRDYWMTVYFISVIAIIAVNL